MKRTASEKTLSRDSGLDLQVKDSDGEPFGTLSPMPATSRTISASPIQPTSADMAVSMRTTVDPDLWRCVIEPGTTPST